MRLDLKPIAETMTTIRDAVSLLPRVVRTLDGIHDGVKEMGDEVHKMRLGVDEMKVEVKAMRGGVDPLEDKLETVAARVEDLQPQLDDLSLALHPMRRATGKLGRRKVRVADDDAIIEIDDAENGLGEVDAAENGDAQIDSAENVSQVDGSPDS